MTSNETYDGKNNSTLTNTTPSQQDASKTTNKSKEFYTQGPTLTHTLHYPWGVVVSAYESRFPTNPHFSYIKKTDVEKDVEVDGVQSIQRVITIDIPIPLWLKKVSFTLVLHSLHSLHLLHPFLF
eukprot:TRINITY_DN2601_c0_g1_i8.p1 TRINITY_DN2601_c0_g1~~TRINITY_DN2601_c0_g1_i8.p1  ORF type:complete len:125 (-),score=27.82 TRINITY_DN2601_c0_g1_i8:381-755(-)